MAKKSFRTGIDSLIEGNLDDINQMTNNFSEKKDDIKDENISGNINIDDISDEKVKWLFIRLKRFQEELKLWRTGKLTLDVFNKSIKEKGLKYNPANNDFEAL